jgi:hypothetical protein
MFPSMTMRKRSGSRYQDREIMFAINYTDGRTAYISVAAQVVNAGDLRALHIARERQGRGELPEGAISGVKRIRSLKRAG